jgi:hypothetical protein
MTMKDVKDSGRPIKIHWAEEYGRQDILEYMDTHEMIPLLLVRVGHSHQDVRDREKDNNDVRELLLPGHAEDAQTN